MHSVICIIMGLALVVTVGVIFFSVYLLIALLGFGAAWLFFEEDWDNWDGPTSFLYFLTGMLLLLVPTMLFCGIRDLGCWALQHLK
jgi:hypothetical protein